MKRWLAALVLCLGLFTAVIAPALPALAATDPLGEVCEINQEGSRGSTVCSTNDGDPVSSRDGIIHNVTVILATIAGAVAVIVIAVAGVSYITSNGDAEKVAKAKRAIFMAIIGLVVIILGQAIINFVISRT